MSVVARTLLIVDDDEVFRDRLVPAMRHRGYEATGVADHAAAMAAARADSPELAVVDLRLAGDSGLTVLRDLKALDPATIVVVLAGYGGVRRRAAARGGAGAFRSRASSGSTSTAF